MHEFVIAPTAGRGVWLVLLIPGIILILGSTILIASLVGARNARFEVSSAGLRLRGDLYGRLIPNEQLKRDSVVRVDFSKTPALQPSSRTIGTALPGYRAGWFRLRNGEKALLYLTDSKRAVYVPTTAGFSVLVSPTDPDAFVAAMRDTGTSFR